MLFQIIIMSISLSIDALGIGASYEAKGITITVVARLVIGLINGLVMALTTAAGGWLIHYFPTDVAQIVGTAVLVLIGIVFIRKALFEEQSGNCDLDNSKDINIWEALLLGCALSVDSVSAGLAVTALGLQSILLPVSVGAAQYIFLGIGRRIARNPLLKERIDQKKSGIFAGCILILIGIIRNM